MFIAYIIVVIIIITIVVLVCIKITVNAKKKYKCPYCGYIFKPEINNFFRLLLNFPNGGSALKCPKFNNKSVMHEDSMNE